MSERKRKGGAEKLREKKKKLLLEKAEKCVKLDKFFHQSASTSTATTSVIIESDSEKQSEKHVSSLGPSVVEEQKASDILFNFFVKPKDQDIEFFLKNHPKQPSEREVKLPFAAKKVFYSEDGVQRKWLTYDINSQKLFCYVCIVFSNSVDQSVFCTGLNDWRHVHQRILEHESSKIHCNSTQAYFAKIKNKDLKSLVWSKQVGLRNVQVKKRRQIIERIVDVVKVIGKRGLSYRGKKMKQLIPWMIPLWIMELFWS